MTTERGYVVIHMLSSAARVGGVDSLPRVKIKVRKRQVYTNVTMFTFYARCVRFLTHAFSHGRHRNRELIVKELLCLDLSHFFNQSVTSFLSFFYYNF